MALNTKTYQPLHSLSIQAVPDIPAFRFVNFSGELCANNTRALGVSEVDWTAGQYAQVVTLGTITVEASAAITLGDDITSSADGKARKATTGEAVNGRALESGIAGDFVRIKLVP